MSCYYIPLHRIIYPLSTHLLRVSCYSLSHITVTDIYMLYYIVIGNNGNGDDSSVGSSSSHTSEAASIVSLMSQVLADGLAHIPTTPPGIQIRETLCNIGLLKATIDCLRCVSEAVIGRGEGDTMRSTQSKPIDKRGLSEVWQAQADSTDLVKECLHLISVLVNRCEVAQQQLKEYKDGLLLVLSSSSTDVYHPLRREWALLCLRNACEGSLTNQEYISTLTLQRVDVVNEQLVQSGLSVDFDPDTGKIKFSHGNNGGEDGA